jgi:hypothetical protein
MKIKKQILFLRLDFQTFFTKTTEVNSGCGAVGSASGLGPEGRQFESGHPDILETHLSYIQIDGFFLSLRLPRKFKN